MLIADWPTKSRMSKTQSRLLLLTALIVLAFRPGPLAAEDLVVCNDGQIPVSISRAYRDLHMGFVGEWEIQGWYTVSPAQCSQIGPDHYYVSPAIGDQSVTLLAFAFTDSTGVWGAAKVPEPGMRQTGWDHFKSSNQQLCVQNGAFSYRRSTSQGDPAKECDRGLPGYYRIPASLGFDGDADERFPEHHILHVSFGPSDRVIPLGSGAAPKTAAPGGEASQATVGTRNSTTAEAGDADALRLKQYPACNVITKAEAEGVLGVSIDPPEPGINLCRYQEPGYGTDSSKKKQVTVGIWRSKAVSPEDVNNRRNAIIKDKSLLPVSYKELPDFGDAALWVWAGGYYGALYAYRGGMIEVAVKISGVPESVALSTAKTFAARALGGASKTGYVYAARNQ
jgi:hypothetical protein